MPFTILKADGTGLSFDVTISEDFSPEIFVTSHPIEDGSTVSDHAQELPNNFSVRSMISFTPFASPPGSKFVPAVGSQRVEIVLDFLKSCIGQLIIIETSLGKVIRNCLLKRYSHSFDVRRAVYFDLQFQVVKIAMTQIVQIRAREKVDTGSNSLEVCDPETDPKAALDVENIQKTLLATTYDLIYGTSE